MFATESPKTVKLAVLSDISTIALFFGQERTNDVLLPLLLSCLNERDRELKCSLLHQIIGVSAVVRADSVEVSLRALDRFHIHMQSFITPCILPEIYDEDEVVVLTAIETLTSMVEMKVLKRRGMFEIVRKVHEALYIGVYSILIALNVDLSSTITSQHVDPRRSDCVDCIRLPPHFIGRRICFFASRNLSLFYTRADKLE